MTWSLQRRQLCLATAHGVKPSGVCHQEEGAVSVTRCRDYGVWVGESGVCPSPNIHDRLSLSFRGTWNLGFVLEGVWGKQNGVALGIDWWLISYFFLHRCTCVYYVRLGHRICSGITDIPSALHPCYHRPNLMARSFCFFEKLYVFIFFSSSRINMEAPCWRPPTSNNRICYIVNFCLDVFSYL